MKKSSKILLFYTVIFVLLFQSNSLFSQYRTGIGGGFSVITGFGSTLPVELLSFTAKLNEEHVDIAWQTLYEKNNNYFILESSIDAQNWVEVSKIQGFENSNNLKNYELKDDVNFKDIQYYRLTQVDKEGTHETFKIISVKKDNNSANSFLVYPNPVVDEVNIEFFSEINNIYSFKIYNAIGQLVHSEYVTGFEEKVHFKYYITSLEAGAYYFTISTQNDIVYSKKIMK